MEEIEKYLNQRKHIQNKLDQFSKKQIENLEKKIEQITKEDDEDFV